MCLIFAVTSLFGQNVVVCFFLDFFTNFLDGPYLAYRAALDIQWTFASKYDIKAIHGHFDRL